MKDFIVFPARHRSTVSRGCRLWERAIFAFFFVFSARLVFVYHYNAPSGFLWPALVLFTAVFLAAFFFTKPSLAAFTASIPLGSGLYVTGLLPANPLSFMFAALFMGWAAKRVARGETDFSSATGAGRIVDLLSTLVFISLIAALLKVEGTDVPHRVFFETGFSLTDPLFPLSAAFILLQGLFLFRIVELEARPDEIRRWLVPILLAQIVTVLFFASLQWWDHIPKLYKRMNVFSPFDDLHALGSYLCFAAFFLADRCRTRQGGQRAAAAVLLAGTLLFLFLTRCRTASAVLVLVVAFLVGWRLEPWKKNLFIAACLLSLLLVNLAGEQLLRSKEYSVRRYASAWTLENYDRDRNVTSRAALWRRAAAMIVAHPLTGTGLGTYFRLSPEYQEPSLKKYSKFRQNTHNYFLQLAAETGLPALGAFLAVIVLVLRSGLQLLKREEWAGFPLKGLIIGLTAYLLTLVFGNALLLSSHQLFFWSILAGVYVMGRDDGFGTAPGAGGPAGGVPGS